MTTDTPPRGVSGPSTDQPGQLAEPPGTIEGPGTPVPQQTSTAPRKPNRRRTSFDRPAEPTDDGMAWRSRGACVTGEHADDPDLWFSVLPADRHRAMTTCYTCPVLATCRAWAYETRQQFGIWGGLDFEVPEDAREGTTEGKAAAARVPLVERVAAVLLDHPSAGIEFVADALGYKNGASLERTLYRRGEEGRSMIRRIKPGSRNKEEITSVTAASDRDHPWLTEAALPVNRKGTNVQHRKTEQPRRGTARIARKEAAA